MIVQRFKGFIVIGQSRIDFISKCNKISRGETNGFISEESYDKKLFSFRHVNSVIGKELSKQLIK